MADWHKEFIDPKELVCPKCKCTDINVRLVTIVGPDPYLRWECSRCGYSEHMKPADTEKSKEEKK